MRYVTRYGLLCLAVHQVVGNIRACPQLKALPSACWYRRRSGLQEREFSRWTTSGSGSRRSRQHKASPATSEKRTMTTQALVSDTDTPMATPMSGPSAKGA